MREVLIGLGALGALAIASGSKGGGSRSKGGVLQNPGGAMKALGIEKKYYPRMQFKIPFAGGSGSPSWPIKTNHSKKFIVSYQTIANDIMGNGARRFLAGRGQKYHAGIDVYASNGDVVMACESGTIVNLYYFFHDAWAMIVQCDSGLVINYGEIKAKSWKEFGLSKGSRVRKGQPIARIGRMSGGSSMLHFECYRKGTKKNHRYFGGDPGPLLNPTYYLLLAAKKNKSSKKLFAANDPCNRFTYVKMGLPPYYEKAEFEQDFLEETSDAIVPEINIEKSIGDDKIVDGP